MSRNFLDFVAVTRHAAETLAPLFDIKQPEVVVVPHRKPGSMYVAEFDYVPNLIYLDTRVLRRVNPTELIHTIGEETGHSLHFTVRSDLFPRAKPNREASAAAFAAGRHAELVQDMILCGNLIEFVGFYAGLRYMEAVFGKRRARQYIDDEWVETLREWTIERVRAEVASLAAQTPRQVIEADGRLMCVMELEEDAVPMDELGLEREQIQQATSRLTHRPGYRCACDVFQLPVAAQADLFRSAIQADTITDFYACASACAAAP